MERNWLDFRRRINGQNRSPNRWPERVDDLSAGPTLQEFAGVLGSITELFCRGTVGWDVDRAQYCSTGRAEDPLIIRRYFGSHIGLAFSTPHWASRRCDFARKTSLHQQGQSTANFKIQARPLSPRASVTPRHIECSNLGGRFDMIWFADELDPTVAKFKRSE